MTKKEFIEIEKSHPDYDKPTHVKYLYGDRVLDLRFIPMNEYEMICRDIRTSYEELGILKKESRNINARVIVKWLQKAVGDYTGLIDENGEYYIVSKNFD